MARTKDETVKQVTDTYLASVNKQNPPSPDNISGDILDEIKIRFDMENAVRQGTKWKIPDRLEPYQVARIIDTLYDVKLVNVGDKSDLDDNDSSLLCMYQTDGPNQGIYVESETLIRRIARLYCPSMTKHDFDEMFMVLKDEVGRVNPCRQPNLVPLNNGIFDYNTKQLLPFSPEMVFLSKSRVNYNPQAKNVIIHNPDDGTDWDVESWMSDLSDDKEVVHLLWQILGALLRPNVPWDKSVWFYSESGNNGKGTLCELMRQLIGHDNYVSLPLADFSKDFMLEPLLHSQAIITDENDVGTYVDRAANLKAIITGDAVSINRKFKQPVTYCFHGIVVQCLNEMPRIRDKSDSFYRRQLFIAFTKCFTGRERKYIKHDYLHRQEVLEYVLYKVLHMDYDSFDVPKSCEDVLTEYKEFNDPIRQFMSEMMSQLKWDLVPFSFLYDLYCAWYRKNFSGKLEVKSSASFTKDILGLLSQYPEWMCEDKRKTYRPGNRMAAAEPLIAEYNLTDWMDPKYISSKDRDKMCHPLLKNNYRGIYRESTEE